MRGVGTITLVALFVASLPSAAASLAECRALAADSARLACYDGVADVLASQSPVSAVERVETGSVPGAAKEGGMAGGLVGLRSDKEVNAEATEPGASRLAKAWELDGGERGHILRIRPYKPVYLLPLFSASQPNRRPDSPSGGHSVADPIDLSSNEAKLQISFKAKLAEDVFGNNGDLWFGYTQSSRWQVYNGGLSRPFRETNHEPELMFVWRTDYDLYGWRGRLVNLSLNHQSNGRSLPLSRSWNRVMLSTSFEKGDWTVNVRPWWRIPESSAKDDNPDISNYIGRADLQLVRTVGNHQFSAVLRHSLRGGANSHGAIQLDYAFPILGELRGHLQWFSGYGESLIDYNHRSNYYGVGVSLLEWY